MPASSSRAQTDTLPASDDRAQIQELLDARSAAVRGGDEHAFLATVSDRDPAFVRKQRSMFRWASSIRFSSYRLEAGWERYGNLARPQDVDRYPGAEAVFIPLTEERYRVAGFDDEPAVEDMYFTFVKDDGGWTIASDTDLNDLTLFSTRHFWDFGRVEQTRSPHFTLLTHRCRSDCPPSLSEDILDLAEQALSRVDSFWKLSWNHHVLILAPEDSEELSRMLQSTFDVDEFVAFAYSTVDVSHEYDYTGDRVILNRDAFAGRDANTTFEILSHELLHVASRDWAGLFMPIFLDEGLAEYVGHAAALEALAYFNSRVAGGYFPGRLPEDYEFTVGSGTEIYESYQEGQSAVRYIVERWSLARLQRLYRYLGSFDVDPGTAHYNVDRAFRKVLGIGFDEFERAWADSITG